MSIKSILIAALLFLFAVLAVQNAQVVEVRFLLWKTEASRALVLLVTFAVGMLAGWLSGLLRKRSSGSEDDRPQKDAISIPRDDNERK